MSLNIAPITAHVKTVDYIPGDSGGIPQSNQEKRTKARQKHWSTPSNIVLTVRHGGNLHEISIGDEIREILQRLNLRKPAGSNKLRLHHTDAEQMNAHKLKKIRLILTGDEKKPLAPIIEDLERWVRDAWGIQSAT